LAPEHVGTLFAPNIHGLNQCKEICFNDYLYFA
jgi:hypothetical protein